MAQLPTRKAPWTKKNPHTHNIIASLSVQGLNLRCCARAQGVPSKSSIRM